MEQHEIDAAAREYNAKWAGAVEDYVEVLDEWLPPGALHQEAASCVLGSKIYLIAGANFTRHHPLSELRSPKAALGTNLMHVYDMADRSVQRGPDLPWIGNHVACAARGGVLHVIGGFRQDSKSTEQA